MFTVDAWLLELDRLTHRERMRRMVQVGRDAEGDPAKRALLSALESSPSVYARTLALQSTYGSRDSAHVLRALRDPSRTVRGRAMRLVGVVCDANGIAAALGSIESRTARTRLSLRLERAGHAPAIDVFLSRPGGLEDPRDLDLLPLGTESFVQAHLATFRERAGQVAWARLAKRRPRLAAAEFEAFIEAGLDPRSRDRLIPNLRFVAKGAPDDALSLLGRMAKISAPFPSAAIDVVLKKRPRETFDLLRNADTDPGRNAAPGIFRGVDLAKVMSALGPERLAYAVKRAHPILPDGRRARRWFLSLSPDERRVVIDTWASARGIGAWGGFLLRHMVPGPARDAAFERFISAARDREGVVPVATLANLPDDLRRSEALRHLDDVPFLAGKPERMAWAALLTFEAAKEALASFLSHPEGELRAQAIRALMSAVVGDRPAIDAALEVARSQVRAGSGAPIDARYARRPAMVMFSRRLPPGPG